MHLYRLAFFLFLIAAPATSFSWPAKVVSVADGDTITVLRNGQQSKIRLYGIDSPEKGQDYSQQAKALTAALVAGRNVDVEQMDIDRYGRVVGLVTVDGQSLNELIIQNGYAWVFAEYCNEKFCDDWVKLEGIARQQKKAMWQHPVVVPPWEWRAAQRGNKQSGSQVEPVPPVISTEEKPSTVGEEPLLSKMRKAFTLGGSSGNDSPTSNTQYRCNGRTYCSQMTSCEEATFFLENCPGVKMDGNKDGVPCERQWCR